MSKNKLIVITETMGVDGPERVISELTKQWDSEGYDITVILTRASLRESTYKLSNTTQVIKCNAYENGGLLKRIREIIEIRKILKSNPDAVCISLMISTSFSLAFASLGLKNYIILSERNDPSKVPFTFLQRKFRDISFEFADKIVFQTRDAMNYFPRRIQNKGEIIFNPVNPELPVRFVGDRKKVFVAAGRLATQKNFMLLLRAFLLFTNSVGGYKLVIYGEGPERENLQKFIDENKLTDVVCMPGFESNVYQKMRDCTAYISSSNYEGMSNSMLEALAMGIPTICTDCPIGGAKQLIINEKNGLLVEVGDVEGLAKAMIRIASDSNFADNLASVAYELRDSLSIDKISKKWSSLFPL